MSVEDMVEYVGEYTTNSEVSAQIIAALKAGQAMAQHLDNCINRHNPPRISYEETLSVLLDWDAATGEKE